MRVDDVDQAVAGEPFSWTQIPTTQVENWVIGRTFTYFAGRHNGYARLADPVAHRRCVLHLHDGLWLVRDVVLGKAEHDLELRWHFAADISVQEAGAGQFVASRPRAPEPCALHMVIPEQNCWKTQITRGLISPAYGRYQPAPVVYSEGRLQLPAEIATALIAHGRPAQKQEEVGMIRRQDASVQGYELHNGNQSHDFFFNGDEAQDGQDLDRLPWTFGPWSTNAEMLYCRTEEEKLVQLIVVGGNTLECHGRPVFEARRGCKFFEWRKHDGMTHASPEMVSTTPWFDELTGGSPSSSRVSTTSSFAEKR